MESSEKSEKNFPKSGLFLLMILMAGLYLRSAGLLHGLDGNASFHPDTLKQVQATRNFLDGQLLWYTGSLAYDGYPYGLNHVDAAMTRLVWPLWKGLCGFIQPSCDLPDLPELEHLFILCRLYRVTFGMITLLLFHHLLKRRELPTPTRLLWVTLAATAPLLSTVTHSASGDVGTDLFVLASLACLMPVVDQVRHRAFFACGLCLGMAFACKYNALLAGTAPGLLWLLLPLTCRQRIWSAAAAAAGFASGVVVLTPAFLIRPEKTFRLIRDNFTYIRNFGVDPEFHELSFFSQIQYSLSANLPQLQKAFGALLVVFLIAVAALILRLIQRKRPSPGLAWDLSLVAMVGVALTLSILGKPAAQPFHFSFLFCPLLLGAAGAWDRAPLKPFVPLLWISCAGIVLHQSIQQRQDVAMWTRDSTLEISRRLPSLLLKPAPNPALIHSFAKLEVEGPSLSVFRNGGQSLKLADATAWETAPQAALPSTPYSFSPDWVFLDLPVFLRDDRLIHLREESPWKKTLIDASLSDEIPLLLRGGERNSTVRLVWNGRTRQIQLAPFGQTALQLSAENGSPFQRESFQGIRHELELSCKGSDVLVRVGPEPKPALEANLAAKLSRSYFLNGNTWIPNRLRHARLLESVHLPPATYRLQILHPPETPLPDVVIEPATLPHPRLRRRFPMRMEKGNAVADFPLPSPSLFSRLTLEYPKRHGQTIEWELSPTGILPETLPPSFSQDPSRFAPQVGFKSGQVVLGDLMIEGGDTLSQGASLSLSLRADLRLKDQRNLNQWVVFVHLLDENGNQVFAKDLRLEEIPGPVSPRALPWTFHDLSLPAGRYQLGLGLYDPATGLRFRPDLIQAERLSNRRAGVATLTVLP